MEGGWGCHGGGGGGGGGRGLTFPLPVIFIPGSRFFPQWFLS